MDATPREPDPPFAANDGAIAQFDPSLEPLSREEDTFALACVDARGNWAHAYRQAFGKDVPYPAANALILLRKPNIARRIDQLRDSMALHNLLSKEEHLHTLAEIRDFSLAMQEPKTAYQAERSRGELMGWYDRVNAATLKAAQGAGELTVLVSISGKTMTPEEHRANLKAEAIDVEVKEINGADSPSE